MSYLKTLNLEYPGDEAWKRFVNTVSKTETSKLLNIKIDNDIFNVATYHIGNMEKAIEWLDKEVPALDGKSPYEVFTNEINGKIIIRSLLMRMP